MPYTLNTAHALYPNLVELIGVKDGALVSHKTARTFTKHAEASYVTGGTYGEAFRTVGGGFTVKGASYSPAVSIDTTANPNATIVIVVNSISSTGGGGKYNMFGSTATAAGAFALGLTSAGVITALENWNTLRTTGTADLDTPSAPHMLAAIKIGETAHKVYVDGSFNIDSATRLAYNTVGGAFWDYIGGATGQGSCAEDVVWIAWFNKALSEAELDSLYSSLGANNAFGLVSAGTPHNVTGANSNQSNIASSGGVSQQSTTFIAGSNSTQHNTCSTGSVVSNSGATIIIPPLHDWGTGNLLPGETNITVWVNDEVTGELVVKLTGQSSHATTAVVTVSDASLVAATQYSVRTKLANGAQHTWTYTAS